MVKDFITAQDLPMFSSGARFTLGAAIFLENRHREIATFDLYIRDLPDNRNYLVNAGLEHITSFLTNYKLTPEHLKYFKKHYGFNKRILDFYRQLRFTGDVWAMAEGSLVFPNEPIVRITAPIVEAIIIEQYLINTLMLQTMLSSKISRLMTAAKNKKVGLTFSRSHGLDSALKSVRCGNLVGMNLVAMPLGTMKYTGLPGSYGAMMCHYYVSFFDTEKEAFEVYQKHFKNQGDILIDTYNNESGLKNIIEVIKNDKSTVNSITLDSGDLNKLSKKVRQELDKNRLNDIKITAMGNLDEYKVYQLEKQGAPIDIYGAATEVINSTDAPKLEVVYKISEVSSGRTIKPKMKLSHEKMSLPGKKQIFRQTKNHKYKQDIIGLEDEKIKGKKLLTPIIKKGKLIKRLPSIKQISSYFKSEKKKFSLSLFAINKKVNYPVRISPALAKLAKQTRAAIKKKEGV